MILYCVFKIIKVKESKKNIILAGKNFRLKKAQQIKSTHTLFHRRHKNKYSLNTMLFMN